MPVFNKPRALVLTISVMALFSLGLSCPGLVPIEPSVLEGTWVVNAEDENLTQMRVTFNSAGKLTRVTYQIGTSVTIEETFTRGTSTVAGDDVTIQSTFGPLNLNTFRFEGTLNEDQTVISGDLTTEIHFLAITITINNGPATLTRL